MKIHLFIISIANFSFIQYRFRISLIHQVEFLTISIKTSSIESSFNQIVFALFSAFTSAFLYQSEKLLYHIMGSIK
ncbi:MAG: hypothetical protein LBQ59_01770 [Candidatus Peribacteria bacterium]|nr:hypothetical protein [Candidatus Peribacteria bacterium]